MNAPSTLPLPGPLLRWIGLLTLAVAIVAGFLGMHMMGGAQASPMAPAHSSSMSSVTTSLATGTPATTTPATTAVVPADAHRAASAAMSIADHPAVSAVPNHLGNTAVCGCSPSGCEMPMASHGSCIPAAGAGTPAAPQPGLVPDPSAGPAPSEHSAYKFAGRLLDPPSLTQLSISRT